MFLVISKTRLRRFSWNLIHGFLNKFAIGLTWFNSFPPHLNNVSTLPCKTWNAHCTHTCYHWVDTERNSRIYPTATMASKFTRFESSWLQHAGIPQEKVYKTCITDLDELKQRLRMEKAKLDHVVIAAACGVVNSCRSVMHVLYTSLAIFPTPCYLSLIHIWRCRRRG